MVQTARSSCVRCKSCPSRPNLPEQQHPGPMVEEDRSATSPPFRPPQRLLSGADQLSRILNGTLTRMLLLTCGAEAMRASAEATAAQTNRVSCRKFFRSMSASCHPHFLCSVRSPGLLWGSYNQSIAKGIYLTYRNLVLNAVGKNLSLGVTQVKRPFQPSTRLLLVFAELPVALDSEPPCVWFYTCVKKFDRVLVTLAAEG